MKSKREQDYSYALNASGVLVKVHEAKRENLYFCPGCGYEMRPHMGKIRRWHFTHKADSECSYESYLHKIAKIRIKEAFLSSEKFFITYNPKHLCSKTCPFSYVKKCACRRVKTFNIREYYDTCEEEMKYDGFVPDLMLCSSSNPDREPIFLEIYVTHKSTEEKIKSGNRIIEIPINSEGDISRIVETKTLKGVDANTECYNIEDDYKIKFFNFEKTYYLDSADNRLAQPKYIFGIKEDGRFRYETVGCCSSYKHFVKENLNLVISNFQINWFWAFNEFQKRGINITNCMRCKFYKHTSLGEKICVLYKKYGTPKSPNISEAKNCRYYKITYKSEDGTPISKLSPGCFNENYVDERKPIFVEFVLQNEKL